MKYSELIRLLKKEGWETVSQRGGHMKMRNPKFDTMLTVPNHGTKEIGKGLATAILKQANLIK